MAELVYPVLSYAVQGAFFDVHTQLRGFNLSEEGWERALLIALEERGIPARRQVECELKYGDRRVGRFFVDVIVDDKLLLELKTVEALLPIHLAQVITYLRITDLKLGILVNFGGTSVEFKRILNTMDPHPLTAQPVEQDFLSDDLLFPELTGMVRSVLYTVHTTLGAGFMHMHYRRAVQIELHAQQINYQLHTKISITYQGRPIETRETRLLVVEGKILLTCVAVSVITDPMRLRMRQYLTLLGLQIGLIANFHAAHMEIVTVRLPSEPGK
jgi:GxxExxY protein